MALSAAGLFGIKLTQVLPNGLLTPVVQSAVNLQQLRYRKTKHWNPKWKKMRALKVVKMELPKYNEKPEDVSEDEVRMKMKERGVLPPRPWVERPFYLSATGGIFEAYVPPEGDGKISPITTQGAKQKLQFLEKKTKSMLAIRKIRSYEEDFDAPDFCAMAEGVYKKVHEYMVAKNLEKLEEVVTERAYPEVVHNIEDKTIHWKFLKSVELPRIVHARCTDIVSKENIFAQVTVRFHTQQLLAIYDRFGRLMHGSEILAKDVLEYVVFEKHLANEYGQWRLHDKIIPDWLPPREPSERTYRKSVEPPVAPETALVETSAEPKSEEAKPAVA